MRSYWRYVLRRPASARDLATIADSKFFDRNYYYHHNPDVAQSGTDPVLHYFEHGAAEGRSPSDAFDTQYYLRDNPDIAIAGINPLLHYLRFGITEGRRPKGPTEAVPGAKPRLAVVGWDLGHNPIGRSFLIAHMSRGEFDVELIGPLFKAYGTRIWEPLQDTDIPVTSFKASGMTDYLLSALEVASKVSCDAVVVCKARLPSILLALLIKHKNGCPLIIDVDDHELSFFENRQPLPLDVLRKTLDALPAEELAKPYGETWTRFAETLIPTMDGLIVSNRALRKKFGGTIVRHGRDEKLFAGDDHMRESVRREFGFGQSDKVILFLGTPRPHKGLLRLAEALHRVNEPNLKLAVIGTITDKKFSESLRKYANAQISYFPNQPWRRLPALVTMADGIFLLQDPEHPISHYQTPAKLAEAMALSVPVVTTAVEPLADVPADTIHRVSNDDELDECLRALARGDLARPGEASAQREYFLEELSYRVNAARISSVVADAKSKLPTWRPEWSELFELLEKRFEVQFPETPPGWIVEPRPPLRRGDRFDVAFFWKQNDSGIYGRRSDMMVKYLARHPRVRKIIQFDVPISHSSLEAMAKNHPFASYTHDKLIYANTVKRFLGLADRANVQSRTYVFSERPHPPVWAGQTLRSHREYGSFVKQAVEQLGNKVPLVVWVCPIIRDLPEILSQFHYSLLVADIVDDQRAMQGDNENARVFDRIYGDTLKAADIVITNCEANRIAFAQHSSNIAVVPNAAERYDLTFMPPRPAEFESMQGPIVGYVGNLRSRIDVDLLWRIASEHPDWHIVLIGSAHGAAGSNVLKLRHLKNVHLLGIRPYDEISSYIRYFNVAIMPHVSNAVSERMNPLKLYVYFSLGVPIVTSNVPNIDEVAPYASVAHDADEFVKMVERAIQEGPKAASADRAAAIAAMSWERRIEQVLDLIDHHVHNK